MLKPCIHIFLPYSICLFLIKCEQKDRANLKFMRSKFLFNTRMSANLTAKLLSSKDYLRVRSDMQGANLSFYNSTIQTGNVNVITESHHNCASVTSVASGEASN